MILIIPGNPKAQPRPQFRRFGNFVSTYDPAKPNKDIIKQYISLVYKNKLKKIKEPILFKLTAFMPIPKSLSLKKSKELIGQYHTKKPDIDNIYKFVSDLLNGIMYEDDSQISKIICEKVYDLNPRVEIEITCLEKS